MFDILYNHYDTGCKKLTGVTGARKHSSHSSHLSEAVELLHLRAAPTRYWPRRDVASPPLSGALLPVGAAQGFSGVPSFTVLTGARYRPSPFAPV